MKTKIHKLMISKIKEQKTEIREVFKIIYHKSQKIVIKKLIKTFYEIKIKFPNQNLIY